MDDENKAWRLRSKLTVKKKRSEACLDNATFAKAMKVKESSEERVNLDSCFKINYISNLSKGVIKKYFWKLKNVQQSKIWSYFNRDAVRSGVTALIAVVKTLFVPPPQFRSTTWIVCVFCSYSLFLWKNLRLLMFENWMQHTEKLYKLFIEGGD